MNPFDYMDKGFAIVVATAAVWGVWHIGKFAMSVWKNDVDERRKTDAENRRAESAERIKLMEAQTKSYEKHVQATDASLELNNRVVRSLELLSISNNEKITHLRNIDDRTELLHLLFHDAIDVAIEAIPDSPRIQEKLRMMKGRVAVPKIVETRDGRAV